MKICHLLVLASMLISSNVFAYDPETQGGSKVLNRIERLERDLTILQKQFYRNEKPSSNAGTAYDAPVAAGLEAKVNNLEEQMRIINGHIEQLQHSIKILTNNIQKTNSDSDLRFRELENKPIASNEVKKPLAERKEEVELAPKSLGKLKVKGGDESELDGVHHKEIDNVQVEFDAAFTMLRSSKFAEAEVAFSKFVEKHPEHKLTSNAYYWLAESYFVQKNYEKSAANFWRSYKKSPKGNKAAESLLKLATSLSHVKKVKEACTTIDKLSSEFANMPANLKNKVQEEFSRIGCK
jgi:tol-pal system protein YbgF